MKKTNLLILLLFVHLGYLNAQDIKKDSLQTEKPAQKPNDLTFTVGLFYGGGVVGCNLEAMLTKHIGLLLGAGYKGFEGGMSYHFKKGAWTSSLNVYYTQIGIGRGHIQVIMGPSVTFRFWKRIAVTLGAAALVKKGYAFEEYYDAKKTTAEPVVFTFKLGVILGNNYVSF